MGIDLGQMFSQAIQNNSQGMKDALQQGGNAALGYLEQQAINLIQQDQADKQKSLQNYVQGQLSQPANPNSFGSYLSGLAQQPVMKQYGPYILGGVAVIVILTLALR